MFRLLCAFSSYLNKSLQKKIYFIASVSFPRSSWFMSRVFKVRDEFCFIYKKKNIKICLYLLYPHLIYKFNNNKKFFNIGMNEHTKHHC